MATQSQAPVHDKAEQLQAVQQGLLEGERVMAVFDGKGAGTGFLGLTDRRLIFQDNSFVGKKTALTSVPYNRVNAVSFVSDKSMFGKWASSATLVISAGGKDYEVEFRGSDKARYAHDLILFHMR